MKEISLRGEILQLLPEKAMYWPRESAILIADLHLGKITHFRKAGIALPPQSEDKNWQTLSRLIRKHKPKKLIILGDLFHSKYNDQWENFIDMTERYDDVDWILVKGNHDILRERHYDRSNLSICDYALKVPPFLLTHEPDEVFEDLYTLCGHIHPGIRLKGMAKQSLRLPCFFFGQQVGILPAFGVFTGLHVLHPNKDDRVMVIAEDQIVEIENPIRE